MKYDEKADSAAAALSGSERSAAAGSTAASAPGMSDPAVPTPREALFAGLPRSRFDIAFTEEEIQRRVAELAAEIEEDYAGKDLILIAMLKGSVHFLSDLSRRLGKAHLFDFIAVKNRLGKQNRGMIELSRDITIDIEGKDVLVLEEVVRTGFTTNFMIQHLESKNPRSVKLAAFLSNPKQMLLSLPLRYKGFEIGFDRYVGYGLDYKEHGRSLPFIAKLNPDLFRDVVLPNRSAAALRLEEAERQTDRATRALSDSDVGQVSTAADGDKTDGEDGRSVAKPRWIKGNEKDGYRI